MFSYYLAKIEINLQNIVTPPLIIVNRTKNVVKHEARRRNKFGCYNNKSYLCREFTEIDS